MDIPELRAVLGRVAGAAVQAEDGPWDGNPRDGYGRVRHLRANGERVSLRASSHEAAQALDAPPIPSGRLSVTVAAPSMAERMEAWRAIVSGLAELGARDVTWLVGPAPIVDDVEAAGDVALAQHMRQAITSALLEEVPLHRAVTLGSTRPHDLGAVLRAYARPESIVSISLVDVGISALPAELARFPNVRSLALGGPQLRASALRGWSLPSVDVLALTQSATTDVATEDLRGLPSVTLLALAYTPLSTLDEALLEVCPKLRRVTLSGTPLSRDAHALARLRAAWPSVHLEV